jgi:hypothetical protein
MDRHKSPPQARQPVKGPPRPPLEALPSVPLQTGNPEDIRALLSCLTKERFCQVAGQGQNPPLRSRRYTSTASQLPVTKLTTAKKPANSFDNVRQGVRPGPSSQPTT